MSLPLTDNITIYRGDDFKRTYQLATGTKTSNTPINLTGTTILAQLRKVGATTATPLATFTITDRNDVQGQFSIRLPNAVTKTLQSVESEFDIELIAADGTVTTYVRGAVEVVADVSRV